MENNVKGITSKPMRAVVTFAFLASMALGGLNITGAVAAGDSCYTSVNTAVFNENTLVDATIPAPGGSVAAGLNGTIKAFYNDEHTLTIGNTDASSYAAADGSPAVGRSFGIDSAGVTHGGGTLSTGTPLVDSLGVLAGPAAFVTDLTVKGATSKAGDWQSIPHDLTTLNAHAGLPRFVAGTWKPIAAYSGTGLFQTGADTAQNKSAYVAGGILGPGADPLPSDGQLKSSEGFNAELVWGINDLKDQDGNGLVGGHTYRVQLIMRDGDHNADRGEACFNVTIPQANVITHPDPTNSPGSDHIAIPIGTNNADTALLSGNAGVPQGTVDFYLYDTTDQTCSVVGGIFASQDRPIDGTGKATSAPYTFSSFGKYTWIAWYHSAAGSPYANTISYNGRTYASKEDCGDETVDVVDVRISINPPDATNTSLSQHHTLTATVESTTDGTTYAPVPNGKTVTMSLINQTPAGTAVFDGASTCTTGTPTSGSGACSLSIHATKQGQVTIRASVTGLTLPGVIGSFSRATGDGLHGDSADAVKRWIGTTLTVVDKLLGIPVNQDTFGVVTYTRYDSVSACTNGTGGTTIGGGVQNANTAVPNSSPTDVTPGQTAVFTATYNGQVNGVSESFTTACDEKASSGV